MSQVGLRLLINKKIFIIGLLDALVALSLAGAGRSHDTGHFFGPVVTGPALTGKHGGCALLGLFKLQVVVDVQREGYLLHVMVGPNVGKLPSLLLITVRGLSCTDHVAIMH